MRNLFRISICVIMVLSLFSCGYTSNFIKQIKFTTKQKTKPTQNTQKQMLESETFLVMGKTIDKEGTFSGYSTAVAAYSNLYVENELVDIMHYSGVGTHFGLYLPGGVYDLVVFADKDRNRVFDENEAVGRIMVTLNKEFSQNLVFDGVDISLDDDTEIDWNVNIALPETIELKESLFYPKGTIRNLDDPIFDEDVTVLGMYHPAEFLSQAHTMFYALEEDLGHKIPVIFVHGFGGSARAFKLMVEKLDRDRYKPWFFYYPSGADLDQMSEVFYKVFLSGKVIPMPEVPQIIVTHSMGGLIVREALNKYTGAKSENKIDLLITIACPFGGQPSAATGEKYAGMVLPSWRDMNPDGPFIKNLYRKPLPDSINHKLIYAFGNTKTFKFGDNSDGVVPLSSQLYTRAQEQSDYQYGFDSNHSGILDDEKAIQYIIDSINEVKSPYPEEHMEILAMGGYDEFLDNRYKNFEKYYIHSIGKYMKALHIGEIYPVNPIQEHFVQVMRENASPENELETGWLKFIQNYPELFN